MQVEQQVLHKPFGRFRTVFFRLFGDFAQFFRVFFAVFRRFRYGFFFAAFRRFGTLRLVAWNNAEIEK